MIRICVCVFVLRDGRRSCRRKKRKPLLVDIQCIIIGLNVMGIEWSGSGFKYFL